MESIDSYPAKKLADEYAIALSASGKNIVVVMASPYDLEQLVMGWLFSQSVIDSVEQVYSVDVTIDHVKYQARVDVELASRCEQRLQVLKRPYVSTAGCGVCGVEALEQALPYPRSVVQSAPFPVSVLDRRVVTEVQVVAKHSGALHAACLVNSEGCVVRCFEDIGRHNALDKLVGYIVQEKPVNLATQAIVITSRCGVELVYKAANVGVSCLASFAAPSELAVVTAESAGIQLIHLTKHDGPLVVQRPLSKHE